MIRRVSLTAAKGAQAKMRGEAQGDAVYALIKSLETLLQQSTEALGADAPSTLNLKEQLAATLAQQEPSRKVFWIKPVDDHPGGEKKS